MGKQLTTKQFIQRAKKVHGDKFDYIKMCGNLINFMCFIFII